MKRFLAALCVLALSAPLFGHEKEGGIIGTGVVGQITALDQFEVSGMRFDLPADTQLLGVDRLEDLREGMTLVMNAAPQGDAWQATQIRRMPMLTGPKTGPSEVMGVPVEGDLPDAPVVTVDGFWSKTGLVATYATASDAGPARVSGVYDAASGSIGTLPVSGPALGDLTDGAVVTAFGQFADGVLIVDRVDTTLFTGTAPDLVLVEGFFSRPDQNDEVSLGGIAFAAAETENMDDMGNRVRRCALRGRLDYAESALSDADQATIASFCVSATPR